MMVRRRRMACHVRSAAGGYALLATLVVVLIMTLLASTVALTTGRAVEDRRLADLQLQNELDATSTAATVMYLLSTQRQTFAGLTVDDRMVLTADELQDDDGLGKKIGLSALGNEIRLDGTTYLGLGGIRFSVQDDRGLANPDWQSPAMLVRLLAVLKTPAEDMGGLLAKLKDYQDADDLPRLNGAEAAEYRKAKLPPPANRPLATPLELRRVMGWDRLLAGMDDTSLLATFSLSRNPVINVNTAGDRVLQMLPGLSPEAATRCIQRRQLSPFASAGDFTRFAGLVLNEDDMDSVGLYPGGAGTLNLWSDGLGYLRTIHWELTPLDDGGAPWRSQYSLALPLPETSNGLTAQKPGAKVFDDALPSR